MKKNYLIFFLILSFAFGAKVSHAATCATDIDCQTTDPDYVCEIKPGDQYGTCKKASEIAQCTADEQCGTYELCLSGECKFHGGFACPSSPADCASGKCEQISTILGKQNLCTCLNAGHCKSTQYCGTDKVCYAKKAQGAECTKATEIACISGICEISFGETKGTCAEPKVAEVIENLPPLEKNYTAKFKLQAEIPNMPIFTETPISAGSLVSLPWIAQYVSGVYRYAIGFGSLISVLLLLIGGIKYLLAGANLSQIQSAKSTIVGSIIGLIIFASSYLILSLINPTLITLESTTILSVEPIDAMEWANSVFGTDGETALGLVSPGKFASAMNSKETCGNRDGLSLPDPQDRIDRLKKIVDIWKQISYNQGGAIYTRGSSCEFSTFSQFKYQVLSINALFKSYPEAFVQYDGTPCYALEKYIAELPTKDEFKAFTQKIKDEKKGGVDAVKQFGINSYEDCSSMIDGIYKDFFLPRARQAGLICADCGSFIGHLYNCFNKNTGGRVKAGVGCGTGVKNYVFTMTKEEKTDAKLDEVIEKLQFGDVMYLQLTGGGHYILYTGKVGLPYEILEMGGGGWNDIKNKSMGSSLATKHMGIEKAEWSGVNITTTAKHYLSEVKNFVKICAYRPLDDNAYAK
ncbi:MAG: hypothetical protein WCT18_02370 [Patescibacteria group bacterium]